MPEDGRLDGFSSFDLVKGSNDFVTIVSEKQRVEKVHLSSWAVMSPGSNETSGKMLHETTKVRTKEEEADTRFDRVYKI